MVSVCFKLRSRQTTWNAGVPLFVSTARHLGIHAFNYINLEPLALPSVGRFVFGSRPLGCPHTFLSGASGPWSPVMTKPRRADHPQPCWSPGCVYGDTCSLQSSGAGSLPTSSSNQRHHGPHRSPTLYGYLPPCPSYLTLAT